jgi:hypothetical protein
VVVLAAVVVGGFAWRANLLGIRTELPFGSVATAFDLPPADPGYTWSRDGRPVSNLELATVAGPEHCHWDSATFLFIGWPPGTLASTSEQARQYVRDPQGVISRLEGKLERNVTLPTDARPTGYRLGAIQLYLSASDQDRWIYIVSPSDAERWPRSDPMTLCA